MNSSRIYDLFDYDYDEFKRLLDDADIGAGYDWEMDFVEDMRERFAKYGERTFITDKQLAALEKIADR